MCICLRMKRISLASVSLFPVSSCILEMILHLSSRTKLMSSMLISVMLSIWLAKLLSRMAEYRYFKDEEFRKAQPSCSLSDMDDDFMSRLDQARELASVPFVVNSAYRPVAYEKLHGRSGTSIHCLGKAVDIRAVTSDVRYRIVSALISVGFRRIGIANTFIHVDSGYPEASNPIIWLY